MNSERCLQFLQNRINEFMDKLPLQECQYVWFQQNDPSCRNQLNLREYIRHIFNGIVIYRYSDIFKPARYPDLTPLEYFL